MKLHNLSVIFIVIALPLILITAYYISLQIDTINMQTAYNTKLLDSTKEAIDAFEINTVEWNANYSETADSKRRDVRASINTFTTSFANNIGIGGTSKEYILSYMPAIAYTLYDGYYIYSPSNIRVALTDDNGVGITMTEKLTKDKIDGTTNVISGYIYKPEDEGKLLYVPKEGAASDGNYCGKHFTLNPEDAATEYKHILKPFASYSEKIGDMVINYTLDNYVTAYGNVKNEETGEVEYVSKAGYLTDPDKIELTTSNSISGIKFNGNEMQPEYLSEQVAYKWSDRAPIITGTFNYVYEAEGNTKVYFEGDTAFIIDSNLIRTDLSTDLVKYKKITIPQKNNSVWTHHKVYQNLYNGEWYNKDEVGNYNKIALPGGISNDKKLDYSAINYCVESYIFTLWFNKLELSDDIKKDETGMCNCGYSHGSCLSITSSNDPEDENSDFLVHRRGIIKKVVESNLNQAITSYSRNSSGEYQLPNLTETDWDQILTNVSIITFVQNIPIGMKYYNNYAIATSTVNKEYVDPDEIYLNAKDDNYYHMPYCAYFEKKENIIGYRSIDYVQKSYSQIKADETNYYYKHSKPLNNASYYDYSNSNINVDQACYYCLVQKSLYEENKTTEKSDAYYTALARERYVARMSKLPARVEPGYYINVVTDPAGFGEIYIDKNGSRVLTDNGGATKQIKEADGEDQSVFTIYGENNDISEISAEEIDASSTGLESEKRAKVKESALGVKACYTTKDKINVKIIEYNNDGIKIGYEVIGGNPDYGAGDRTDNFGGETEISSEAGTGYVNVKLHYTNNYNSGADSGAEVWANINDYNNLTIVTKPINITGKVRLKFTNSGKEYYSMNTFNVNEGDSIYCEIPNNTAWYDQEWHVDILNVANDWIAGGDVSYYTINDAPGLIGFANATNSYAKTGNRKFYLINNIAINQNMSPICQSEEGGRYWFDGIFDGGKYTYNATTAKLDGATGSHTISDLGINVENNSKYAFGLFGFIGSPGKVSNLIIDNINIDLSSYTNNNHYVGGLAGKADSGSETSIENVEVKNSTIKGTTYVGGIVGENKKEIKNSRINGTSISSLGTKNDTNNDTYIYVGGIAAKSTANISGCYVEGNSTVGGGEVNIWSRPGKHDKYFVGGIVGYTEGTVTSSTLNSSSNIKGGKINQQNSARFDPSTLEDYIDYYETYTGGVIGYKNSSQAVDSNFSVGCTVSGHDNVGGIIGFNAGGDIDNVQFSGTISSGTGENIGGIVGCNAGGNISKCTNKININVTGKSVGGIAGCNYNKNITNCYNNASVKGNQNVGGIVGICYGGTIDYCGNNNTVTGNNNQNAIEILENDVDLFYYTAPNKCTGTGGITGKLYRAKVLHSYNSGNINCNYNGGGISGLNYGGTVEYSYNSGTISSSGGRNRLGGICGAGDTVYINACYNIGAINGNNDGYVLSNGMGGIIGSCVDNAYFLYFGYEQLFPDSKYLGEIKVPELRVGQTVNVIIYCYNTGSLNGSTGSNDLNHACGIIGCILWAPNTDDITLESNYYLDNRENGAKGSWSNIVSTGVTKLSANNMKKQLYKWADSSLKVDSEYVYNTVAPMKTDFGYGYEGYGVLWWQLDNYVRLISNIFLCNKQTSEDGTVTYDYTNFKNTGYNQTITLINSENEETKIAFKDTKFDLCRITDSFNGKPVNNTTGCYRWIMMIPKGNYGVIGTTDFGNKSRFFNDSSMLYEGQRYDVEILNNKTLYIAPVLEVVTDRFNIKDIEVEWKREYTTINRYGVYTKPDFIPRTIGVNAYYDKKPSSSSYNINGKKVSINLDKIKTPGLNNTTAYLDDYTYYTLGFFKMNGPYTKSGDTEEVRADSAECNVYIPVENLVDRLGADSAKNYILHTAKINMKYRIRMWCEKGDFGSWFTNPAKLKNSTLEYNITVQRKEKGSSNWVDIKSINVPTQYKKQTSESGNIGDDGYYVFEYEIDKEDFSGSLIGVNYDDELRIVVRLDFVSKEGNCTFYIDSADLDITYGPNVTE